MELEEIKKLTAQGEGEYFGDLEKGIRPAFGSPGGKRYLAKTIVSYIPEHKTYVEPFIGGGAVFFAKEPSEIEVINDLDKDIAFAYKFIQKITENDVQELKKKDWIGNKKTFEGLKNSIPETKLTRLYKFLYMMRFSRFKNYVSSFEGQESDCTSALPNIKERLKNVKIENNDYKESINYDSKETFYYLDPPYPDTENKTIGGNISLIELHGFCKKIKGKFMLSLNDVKAIKEVFKDFHLKKVKVLQSFSNTEGTQEFRRELLISNFPLKKENIYLSKSDKVLIEDLPSFVWVPEFINIAGSLFYEREGDRKPNDIDIIVRAKEEDDKFTITLDKSLRLKIDRILEQRVGEMSGKWLTPEWLGSTFGPNWRYQTGWDLVLVPHQPQEIREMNEPEFAEEFYKEENYEEFCDFGSGRFSKFVMEHPEFNTEEFRGYVIVHNKADRDSGELEDIATSEILRLAKEFAQEKNIQIKKYKHSREKCMECDEPPVYECIWAEGIGHAWFCKEHFKEWATTGDGKGEIISVKEVKDGIAAKKFGDNRNPNIWAELKREFSKDEGMEKKLSDKQREEYDKETAIINENKKKPQAKKVHQFKVAKYTHPNGHPRCLICGDEEPIGGVCNMPDSWYQKHEFDDEEAWKKEREILREKGIIKQGMDWVNSPTFAYQAVYNKLPPTPLRGKTDSPKRIWNNIEVDKEFKDRWLEDLNSIPGIEVRATDIGHSSERVAFVVFRMRDPKDDCKVKAISDGLSELKGLYSKYDTGREGRLRIVVAGKIKLGDKDWEEWWNSLAGKIKNIIKDEFEKLDLEQFRAEGIDDDLKNPAVRHKELFADLRYLGNSGYPKLKGDKKWGEWKLEDALKYYAAIVDALRSVYFPVISPKIGDEGYRTSYWECYREARKYMKSKPPSEKDIKEWDEKRKEIIKVEKIEKSYSRFKFMKIDKSEFIVGGVVYYSNKQDSQEDWASPPEVWKALKNYMIKRGKIKVMHQGKEKEIPIVENYYVEEKHHKGGMDPEYLLKVGDWWLAVYLGDKENKDIWERVLKGELTGFSIAGRASSPS